MTLPASPSPTLVSLAYTASVGVQVAVRASNAVQVGLERVVLNVLTPQELEQVTLMLYGRSRLYAARAPMAWEQRWWPVALGSTPLRVLVVGGGGGAEALQLQDLGHTVFHTDGAGPMVEAFAAQHPGVPAGVLTFAALAAWRVDGAEAPPMWAGTERWPERFDAVVLGWSALSHVADDADCERLLQAAGSLCPAGPVLFSAFCDAWNSRQRSRIGERYGSMAGRGLGKLLGRNIAPTPGACFFSHVGYVHRFSEARLRELAALTGRSLVLDHAVSEYPYGRFVPL